MGICFKEEVRAAGVTAGKSRTPRVLMAATVGISVRGGLTPFARHFRAKGWIVDGMANGISHYQENHESFDCLWEASWSRNPLHPGNFTAAVNEVVRAVGEREYDLIHVHTPVASFVTRYALRNGKNKPKIVYTAHGFHFHPGGKPWMNLMYRSLEKKAGPWTDYIVVINKTDERACQDHGIVPRHGVVHIPGIGINTRRFSKDAVDASEVLAVRRELGISEQSKVFLMAAEFNPGKRHVDFLRALASLKRSDIHVLLAGDGPLMEQTKRLARELNVADRVHHLGFRRDIPVLMRAAEALVLPSDREGLPLCILEAMSLEVPVIASNARGSRDLVDGGYGHLFPVGNPGALASAMQSVVENPEAAADMATAAHKRMAQFDEQNVKRMHEDLYQRLLSK